MDKKIPFARINEAALSCLEPLLIERFPGGRRVGREFKIGNLSGDVGKSLSINIDTGKWADFADGGQGGDPISLWAALDHKGSRVDAARYLGKKLGVYTNGGGTPVTAPSAAPVAPTVAADDWTPMMPPPAGTPDPTPAELRHHDALWTYRDATGARTHYVRRVNKPDGGKDFFPLVYGRKGGSLGWHSKHPATPRPLYGLQRLAARPDAPVMIVEGEKAADAASYLFPEFVVMSWEGGSGSVDVADWTALTGRDVRIIWPDNDAAGAKAALALAKRFPAAQVLSVADMIEGGDAADIMPDDPAAWLRDHLPPDEAALLCARLSVATLMRRTFPPEVQYLGSLVTQTSRLFLIGSTGLGKTMLGLALAVGMASGTGFLNWRSARKARVLYIDGEMPVRTLHARIKDATRRAGLSGEDAETLTLFPLSWQDAGELGLGPWMPLNTPEGQQFIVRVCDLLKPDVVLFDNVQALLTGDMKDEVPWNETSPLVSLLTAREIGQIWFDHTGHDTTRQYGSSVKAWRFDSVGIMTSLPNDAERRPTDTGFSLSFDAPGKARNRSVATWREYETTTIRLRDDAWTGETAGKSRPIKNVPPSRLPFYAALSVAITTSGRRGEATKAAWEVACIHKGLIEPPTKGLTESNRRRALRTAQSDFIEAGWITVEGERVIDLHTSWA